MTKISLIDLMDQMAQVYEKEIAGMMLKEYYLARFDNNNYGGKEPQDYYLLKAHDLRTEGISLKDYSRRKASAENHDGLFYVCRFENPKNSHDEVNLIFDFSLCLYFFIEGHQDTYLRCCDYEINEYVGDFITIQTEGFNTQVYLSVRKDGCKTVGEAVEMAKAYCFCSETPEVHDLYWNWEQKVKMAPIAKVFEGVDGFAIILDKATGWILKITDKVEEDKLPMGGDHSFNFGCRTKF